MLEEVKFGATQGANQSLPMLQELILNPVLNVFSGGSSYTPSTELSQGISTPQVLSNNDPNGIQRNIPNDTSLMGVEEAGLMGGNIFPLFIAAGALIFIVYIKKGK